MSVGVRYATAFTNGSQISGFTNVGNIAIDTNPGYGDYTQGNFVGGVNGSYDYNSYIIISDTTTALVDDRSTGNHTGSALPNQPTFFASKFKTDESFLRMVNRLPERVNQTKFTDPLVAATWLRKNGYWTTYVTPMLSLDAGNTASYPGTGNVWTDTISDKRFNLYNGAGFDPGNGGKFYFHASSGQYAQSNTSLPNLSTWSVGVWHYYTGSNVGGGMCIVTEVYPGSTYQINYSLGDNDTGGISSGFFDGGWETSGAYNLTPNNWYYIVGTYDGTTNNLYVNGNLVQSNNYTSMPMSSGGGIRLMRRWDNADYWDGYLATVDIYEHALDSSKITSIFEETKSRFGL
jgi:hypothetical protein